MPFISSYPGYTVSTGPIAVDADSDYLDEVVLVRFLLCKVPLPLHPVSGSLLAIPIVSVLLLLFFFFHISRYVVVSSHCCPNDRLH